MSDLPDLPPEEADPIEPERRCPFCDTVVATDAVRCLMCGQTLGGAVAPVAAAPVQTDPTTVPEIGKPGDKESADLPTPGPEPLRRPTPGVDWQTRVVQGATAVFLFLLLAISYLILRFQSPDVVVALFPSATPISPSLTPTPTWTPWPTETPRPSATPTLTLTPAPTDTPEAPRSHVVASGETLIGLSLRYRVSPESIASANNFSVNAPIQIGQTLLIPWPTPTPPLVPVGIEIRGELVIADPTDCQRYEVRAGDSLSAIAARFDLNLTLFMRVNRLDETTILQRGDTLCIPEIVFGGSLPPTPGPSPTPSATPPLPGPFLLFPANGAQIQPADVAPLLQWAAVKDLGAAEWYMVEVRNLSDIDQPAFRGFTRDTALRVPLSLRPPVAETHLFRWRVSIVQVTGQRADGQFIYTYGGETSEERLFYWLPGS